MPRSQIFASMLVALVSVPGFLVGQKLRHGEHTVALLLLLALLVVVFLAGMIMRQSDQRGDRV